MGLKFESKMGAVVQPSHAFDHCQGGCLSQNKATWEEGCGHLLEVMPHWEMAELASKQNMLDALRRKPEGLDGGAPQIFLTTAGVPGLCVCQDVLARAYTITHTNTHREREKDRDVPAP